MSTMYQKDMNVYIVVLLLTVIRGSPNNISDCSGIKTGTSCYPGNVTRTRESAMQYCEDLGHGWTLATSMSQESNRRLQTFMEKLGWKDMWLSWKRKILDKWEFLNGSTVDTLNETSFHSATTGGACATLDGEAKKLAIAPCTGNNYWYSGAGAICQVNGRRCPPEVSPSSCMILSNTTYFAFPKTENFYTAVSLCERIDGQLATLLSGLDSVSGPVSHFKKTVFYLGLKKEAWFHGDIEQNSTRATRFYWGVHSMDGDRDAAGDCAILRRQDVTPPFWLTRNCNANHHFLCQKGLNTIPSSIVHSNTFKLSPSDITEPGSKADCPSNILLGVSLTVLVFLVIALSVMCGRCLMNVKRKEKTPNRTNATFQTFRRMKKRFQDNGASPGVVTSQTNGADDLEQRGSDILRRSMSESVLFTGQTIAVPDRMALRPPLPIPTTRPSVAIPERPPEEPSEDPSEGPMPEIPARAQKKYRYRQSGRRRYRAPAPEPRDCSPDGASGPVASGNASRRAKGHHQHGSPNDDLGTYL